MNSAQARNAAAATQRTSGDLIADRRFAFARAALADGDSRAAADVLEQTIELAPQWAPAWFALGECHETLGARDNAVEAYRRAAEFDEADALGARLRLARLDRTHTLDGLDRAPPAYVRALFDGYAGNFESHLVEALGYCGPALLRDALARVCSRRGRPLHFNHAIDLGCGTGLMAQALRDRVARFSGVDISPAMVAQARRSGLYGDLSTAALDAFLAAAPDAGADLVLAADVFIYVGALGEILAAAARALERGGLFAFTTQAMDGGDFHVGDDLRFAHSENYLRGTARKAGLAVALLESAPARRDRGVDSPGFVAVLAKD